MAKSEADIKRDVIAALKKEGGYGRRIEDQYSVGMPDTILIPKGGPVFFAEFKIIRAANWGATPRQFEELRRIAETGCETAVPVLIGYGGATKRLYAVAPSTKVLPIDMTLGSMIEKGQSITDLLQTYYLSRRPK